MSLVRYTNKKTGVVALYESTSYYDPVTKQSRPKRKYLGTEDPVTGELIPSTKKKGRRKSDEDTNATKKEKTEERYREKYEKLLSEFEDRGEKIKQLEHENKRLKYCLQNLRATISGILGEETW